MARQYSLVVLIETAIGLNTVNGHAVIPKHIARDIIEELEEKERLEILVKELTEQLNHVKRS